MQRWIGVDVGEARVGLAVSDPLGTIALPHATVSAKTAVAEIVALCAEHEANVVIGWPLELSGQAGRAARRVDRFIEALEHAAAAAQLSIEVQRRDERLTTGLAATLLAEAEVFGKRRKGAVDQVAATQILQGFLDERRDDEAE